MKIQEILNEAKPNRKEMRKGMKELNARETKLVDEIAQFMHSIITQEARYQFFSQQDELEADGMNYDEWMKSSLNDEGISDYLDEFAGRVKRKMKKM